MTNSSTLLPIDPALVAALSKELCDTLKGGRIQKVQMPSKDLILLTIRSNGENHKLLLSCATGKARAHLTSAVYENPAEPPMLCMLLRKHLNGAELTAVEPVLDDRILIFRFTASDELGRSRSEQLIVEMLGRCPNVVLTDDSGHIIDCVHRRDGRNPGLIYRFPEKNSAVISHEVPKGNLSELLDECYSARERDEIYRSKAKALRTNLNSAIRRTEKKLASRMMELQKTEGREQIRERAELLTANLWKIRKGDTVLRTEDYYHDNAPVEIPLDPLLPPSKQAEKLFKEYTKLKKAESYLTSLISEAENQLDFLRSEQDFLSRARSDPEIDQIRTELENAGFLRQSKASRQKVKAPPGKPLTLFTPSGLELSVGRNQTENEAITFRMSDRDDLWFHVRNYHGSHVVLHLQSKEPSTEDLLFAARTAAEYSEAHGDGFVDYTEIRNVKKIRGALPGKVTYSLYSTVRVQNPDNGYGN